MAVVSPNPVSTLEELVLHAGEPAIVSWTDHRSQDAVDQEVVDKCIDRATGEMMRTAGRRYSHSEIAADPEMREWGTILACFFASKTRGNPPAMELVDDVDYIRAQLALIAEGTVTLQLALKSDMRPRAINRTVDRRYAWHTIRQTPDSTKPRSVLPENRVDDVNYGLE